MAIRKLNMTNDWTWHILKNLSQVKQNDVRYEHLDFFRCMGDYHLYRVKSPRLHKEEQGGNAIYGSFLYGSLPDQKGGDDLRLIYYVSEGHLFTAQLQLSRIGTNESELLGKLQPCSKGYEGLIGILCEIAQSCHTGLDKFEEELIASERNSLHSNHTTVPHEQLMARQYELVLWRHRIVPLEELLLAIGEAFPASRDVQPGEVLHVLDSRVQRLTLRLKRYEEELRVLLTMDGGQTMVNGDKLMKPSAMFPMLGAQTAVLTVCWGISYFVVPGRQYYWVYGGAVSVILLMTAFIYIRLGRRGWTGVLIRGKKRNSNIT
jgi:magnesium transporter